VEEGEVIALIPARAGSKRIPGKNTKPLAGHPLIAYTIAAAQQSGVFEHVMVCSDDESVKWIACDFNAEWAQRTYVDDEQPDIVWVREALSYVRANDHNPDAFAILRPTSPFRTAETIRRAYQQFVTMAARFDSIRAVEPAKQSPYKMWRIQGADLRALYLDAAEYPNGLMVPFHSCPTQVAPKVYAQNASLEMSWTRNVTERQSISGHAIAPFLTQGYEGFDINEPRDWREAEYLIASGQATLPEIHVAA
jgi:CMP-N,N'-diacetyllegionaminic acid synthase